MEEVEGGSTIEIPMKSVKNDLLHSTNLRDAAFTASTTDQIRQCGNRLKMMKINCIVMLYIFQDTSFSEICLHFEVMSSDDDTV